jgi:gluconolactonase
MTTIGRDMNHRVLASKLGFTEGPIFRQEGDYALVSLDTGRLVSVTPDGDTQVLAETGGGPNGAAEGPDGTIYLAECSIDYRMSAENVPDVMGRCGNGISGGVQAVHPDGTLEIITLDPYMPNDLCFGPDGLLYVTDPTRILGSPVYPKDGRLWRIDVESHDTELLTSTRWFPNGIGFGKEDDAVYVASSGEDRIYRLPLTDSGLGKEELVIQLESGAEPDGFTFDVDGHIIIATNYGGQNGQVQMWTLDGELVETFQAEGKSWTTNVALDENGTLLVCYAGGGALIVIDDWPARGLPLYPFRNG